jgi:hypothetical protein
VPYLLPLLADDGPLGHATGASFAPLLEDIEPSDLAAIDAQARS